MTGDLETRPLAQALAEMRARFVAALSRADTEALAALYTADATLLPPAAAPISGREAISALLASRPRRRHRRDPARADPTRP